MILLNFCKGREFLGFFVEVLTKFDLGEARPDLSGNPFLLLPKLCLKWKRQQKRLGAEGG